MKIKELMEEDTLSEYPHELVEKSILSYLAKHATELHSSYVTLRRAVSANRQLTADKSTISVKNLGTLQIGKLKLAPESAGPGQTSESYYINFGSTSKAPIGTCRINLHYDKDENIFVPISVSLAVKRRNSFEDWDFKKYHLHPMSKRKALGLSASLNSSNIQDDELVSQIAAIVDGAPDDAGSEEYEHFAVKHSGSILALLKEFSDLPSAKKKLTHFLMKFTLLWLKSILNEETYHAQYGVQLKNWLQQLRQLGIDNPEYHKIIDQLKIAATNHLSDWK